MMRPFSFWLLLPLLLLLGGHPPAVAQASYNISGHIRSAESGETLIGAVAFVPELSAGVSSNAYGFYSLAIPPGFYRLQFSYLGYQMVVQEVEVRANLTLNVDLPPADQKLREVVVQAGTLREKLNTTQMSVENLTMREARLLPALFGEVDILKTLQLKPGIQSGGEGTSGLYVRGGGPDQNLILLDEATVYNASHLFGFFSIFNPDAVSSIDLYKGGFPAQFGGRLSSVVDVKLREGNNQRFSASGGIGLIASRLTLEGPIVKNKSSFILSGRRTYFDVFTRQINRLNEGNRNYNPIPDYYFYDLNGKVNYEVGPKDRLFLSGYLGNDRFVFRRRSLNFGFEWGNRTASARWNHVYSPRLFSNTTVTASSYQYRIANTFDVFSFDLSSEIKDLNLKVDFDYLPNNDHTVKLGGAYTHHRFGVGRLKAGSQDEEFSFSAGSTFTGHQYGLYAADDYRVNERWSLNYGLRLSGFANAGTNYNGLEPRASARYNLNDRVSLKGSYARMLQYVHLVSNTGASLPTDIWYPSGATVRPQRSNQVALGISKLFRDDQYLLTNEVYYKWMRNQVDFRDGANLFVNDNLDQEFLFGKGYSYGNEVYLEKKRGRTTGWVGYTLAWTWRQFDQINEGRRFPTRYDRRHDLSVVAIHQLRERFSLTATFVFGTGDAFSIPFGRFPLQDTPGANPSLIPIFTERNSYRLASYHRLDLGLVYRLRPKRGESDLTFSVYNAYNRRNPFFVYLDPVREETSNLLFGFTARQVSLFPVIPSVTYNFKF
ncbi:TonB-dependent receptor [soil metagenome]